LRNDVQIKVQHLAYIIWLTDCKSSIRAAGTMGLRQNYWNICPSTLCLKKVPTF